MRILTDTAGRKIEGVGDHQYAKRPVPIQSTAFRSVCRSLDLPEDNGEPIFRGIDLPHTSVYLDDILVTGETENEHLSNLDAVLSRLEEARMRVKKNKCEFMLPQVEYLGHKISHQGLQPTESKVKAITNAPAPSDVHQLKSFL